MKVLITDTVDESLIDGLRAAGYACDYNKDIRQEELLDIISEYAGVIITTKISIDKAHLLRATQLQFIARLGSGLDHVDTAFAKTKGIAIYSSPEANAGSVGEHAVGMLISMMHQFQPSFEDIKQGHFRSEPHRVNELCGKTIGILGYGNTGPAFAKRLQGFDLNVIGYDKYRVAFDTYCKKVNLQTLQTEAEIVSIHLPLTEETEGMINADFLKQCKKLQYIINTSRGYILNLSDAYKMLEDGVLDGVALDVMDNEQTATYTIEEKNFLHKLSHHPKVIITPHIAGKSHSTRFQHAQVILRKILGK